MDVKGYHTNKNGATEIQNVCGGWQLVEKNVLILGKPDTKILKITHLWDHVPFLPVGLLVHADLFEKDCQFSELECHRHFLSDYQA